MGNHDVIISGGGMTGVAAAVASARAGAKTLLIEQYGCLGGMATVGHVNPFMTHYLSERAYPGQEVTAGIYGEILDRLEAESEVLREYREEDGLLPGNSPHRPRLWPGNTGFDTEALKWVLDDMVLGAGAGLRFHTFVYEAECAEGKISKIRTVSKSGAEDFSAKVFVDTTGDADIAFRAGFRTVYGREADGKAQAMTTMFRVGDVNIEKMPSNTGDYFQKAVRNGEIKYPGKKRLLMFPYPGKGVISFNQNEIAGLDPTDADELSEAEVRGRKAIRELVAFLKKDVPGFENCRVEQIAQQVGIRETRRIVGDFVLGGKDIIGAAKFAGGIARGAFPVDIHDPEGMQKENPMSRIPDGEYYRIPYRSLLPKESVNLLTAGRCLSATHEAAASVRIMPTCTALGQAAGEAAAMAAGAGTPVSSIDIAGLQGRLEKNKALI